MEAGNFEEICIREVVIVFYGSTLLFFPDRNRLVKEQNFKRKSFGKINVNFFAEISFFFLFTSFHFGAHKNLCTFFLE